MNRRDWLRRTALLATGAIAADQLELLERLTWKRSIFPAAPLTTYDPGFLVSEELAEDARFLVDRSAFFIAAEDIGAFNLVRVDPNSKLMWPCLHDVNSDGMATVAIPVLGVRPSAPGADG